jgi:hypothetical protein
MATTTPATKTAKVKAPAKTVVQRVTEQMKRAALQKKISAEELDAITKLASALKTFLAA